MYSDVSTTIIDNNDNEQEITKRYKLSAKAITRRLDILKESLENILIVGERDEIQCDNIDDTLIQRDILLEIKQSKDELIEDKSFINTYKCIEELKLIQHKFKEFPNRELVLLRNEEETTILIEINNEPNLKYVKANRVPFYINKVNQFWIYTFNTLEEDHKYCKPIHI